ncbi:MAG: SGNH/GDSL hydrolase family protein [Chloroflexota bacterium]|nr:SGNH/GDSL hydrolase family protein [Chloroflexota bacterium]
MKVKPSALSKRSEKLLMVLLAVTSPLLLIGLLEVAAYLWERNQANSLYAWELVASRRMVWVRYVEPGAGYTLMEPGSHYEFQSIPVDINSHGLRGPETPYEKPPSTFRILNLGDSVAMGWGVRVEDTYGHQLEALLNERAAGDPRYEVINAGVPGWNLENALAYLQAEGLSYEPDLILLDVTIANDINGRSALLAGNDPGPFRWLSDHTYFWPFLQSQVSWTKARAQGRDRVDTIDPPTNPAKYFPLDPESDRWDERWHSVLDINRLAEEKNVPVVLILFPLEFQVFDEDYSTLPQEIFVARAAEAGIPALDLLPAFQQACREKSGGSCQLEDRYLFADVWMHPSAEGHKLTADEIEAFLSQMVED